jgi:glutamate racemase
MRMAFLDSGLGVLPVAAECLRLRPDLDVVLSMDPDHMPYGPRPPEEIARLIEDVARAADAQRPDLIVLACNTASVSALGRLREVFEPEVRIVGTVPPIKPAGQAGRPFAVWATRATTGSAYQRDLLARFAPGVRWVEVACPGLAEAVEGADPEAVDRALAEAATATPGWVEAVVLGCTQYPLVRDRIARALGPGVELHDSAPAVAARALRLLDSLDRARSSDRLAGRVVTLASGRPVPLPAPALRYEQGRLLAQLAAASPTIACRDRQRPS